ncbi:MAG: DUF3810 domain-containing protein [Weeksellaceae bacterium]
MNQNFYVYKPLLKAVLFLLSSILGIQILASYNEVVNVLYPKFYGALYPVYTKVLGWVPFSVGDFLYLAFIIYFIVNLYIAIRCFLLNQQWRGIRFIARIIWIVTLAYIAFHVLWGLNYRRSDLIEVYQVEPYQTSELKEMAEDLLQKSKENRLRVEEDKHGVFSFEITDFYKEIPSRLNQKNEIPFYKTPKKAKKKYSLFSWFMRYFGVSGYYNPFTAEAQITYMTPSVSMPFTMAHEQAHQMGYAPEFEANYIGYLTCVESNNSAINYSGQYKALKYVLRAIYPQDSVFVHKILDQYSDGMKRDYRAEREFYDKYDGRADRIFSQMNHLYLKSNHQDQGVRSYNQFVDLLVHYYREKNK